MITEPRRWRLREGHEHSYDWVQSVSGAIFEDGEEVMPVSEHEAATARSGLAVRAR